MKDTLRIVLRWTAYWAFPLLLVLAISTERWNEPFVPYDAYKRTLWCAGVSLVGLLLFGVYRASKFLQPQHKSVKGKNWYHDPVLVFLLVFWALCPPSYFFVEYYAFDQGFIAWSNSDPIKTKPDFLKDLRTYAELASKFWAGAGAVFGTVAALAKKADITPAKRNGSARKR